jgi:hypothetical protein
MEKYPHPFSKEEATARVRALTEYWQRYGVKTTWRGSTAQMEGRVLGVSFTGIFEVTDSELILRKAKYSRLGILLGGRHYAQRKLDQYLDPNMPLGQLQVA